MLVGDVVTQIDHGRARARVATPFQQRYASRTRAREAGSTTVRHRVARGREGKTSFGAAMRGCARTLHNQLDISRFVGANVGARNTISGYLIVIK